MRHLKFAFMLAGLVSLATPSQLLAQTALPAAQKKDMACYVGLSLLAKNSQKDTKISAAMKQNIVSAIFYYAGKIAARHPGKVVPVLVNSRIKEVTGYVKNTNAQKCMDELAATLKSTSAK